MRIFNGIWTIRNRQTGEHRTFRVKTQPQDAQFAAGKRILSLLTGADNSNSYKRFAFVSDNGDRVMVWRKFRGTDKRSAYDMYALMLSSLACPETEDTDATRQWKAKYELMGEKRCIKCNRRLTHPESLITGIGPDCAGRGGNSPVPDAPKQQQPRRPQQRRVIVVDPELDDPSYNQPNLFGNASSIRPISCTRF